MKRFTGTDAQNDSPPPGAYYRPSTLERDARWCGSVSAKGYCGGFVSAVPRFRDVKMLQQAHLPGPGSYNAPTGVGSEGARLVSFSNLNRVIPTKAFLFRDSKPPLHSCLFSHDCLYCIGRTKCIGFVLCIVSEQSFAWCIY